MLIMCVALLNISIWSLNAKTTADDDIQLFLETVRNQPFKESIAILEGIINHKRIDGRKLKFSIELRLKLNHDQISAQIIFNEHERYRLHQNTVSGESTFQEEVIPTESSASSLSSIGFEPGDFTLSFLHWSFESELDSKIIKGQRCRVVVLKHPVNGKRVKIWLSKKHYFPLKVEWSKTESSSDPYKTITFTGFKKENNFWIIKEFKITGEKGKSVVKFKHNTIRLIDKDHRIPDDFFIGSQSKSGQINN